MSISWEYGELILLKVVIDLSCWYMDKKCLHVHYKYNINIINVMWNQYHSKILHGNTNKSGIKLQWLVKSRLKSHSEFLFELSQKIVTAFQ